MSKGEQRKERVRVFCRTRPSNAADGTFHTTEMSCISSSEPGKESKHEVSAGARNVTISYTPGSSKRAALAAMGAVGKEDRSITAKTEKNFTFDGYFGPHSTQEDVYDSVARPVVDSVLGGYNGTVFVYGQTGSGKTHTMVGPSASADAMGDDAAALLLSSSSAATEYGTEERGIVVRALEHIFDAVRRDDGVFEYTVTLSYLQIYCEMIQDLLVDAGDGGEEISSRVHIREAADGSVAIDGLTSTSVANVKEAMALFEHGNSNRTTACTKMNATSSRSHAALLVTIEQRSVRSFASSSSSSSSGGKNPTLQRGKLFLVDLAGSERVSTAIGGGPSGSFNYARLGELKAINLSLSCLGNCIQALGEGQHHVPFRDSKLTRLLRDSLGGNARTSLVVNVSPSGTHARESMSSLEFGQRARAVINRAKRNVTKDYKALYEAMQRKLDQRDDRINAVELERSQLKARIRVAEAQLQDSRSEVEITKRQLQSLEQLRLSISSGTQDGENADNDGEEKGSVEKRWSAALEQMRLGYEKRLAEQKSDLASRFNEEIQQVGGSAAEATVESNKAHLELETVRGEHLETIRELNELHRRFQESETAADKRIAELVEERDEARMIAREQMAAAKANAKRCEEVREHYLAQAKQLEEVYVRKIEMLCARVEQLEHRGSAGGGESDEENAPRSARGRGAIRNGAAMASGALEAAKAQRRRFAAGPRTSSAGSDASTSDMSTRTRTLSARERATARANAREREKKDAASGVRERKSMRARQRQMGQASLSLSHRGLSNSRG